MRINWLLTGASVLVLAGSPALAQDEPTAIEEIVVTARKRAENLQDIPISITAVTAETMERAGLADIADVARRTPGLQYGDFGDLKLSPTSLRGVVGSAGSAGADPAVGYYVDEVFVGQGAGANLDLYDIDRVEVLRGPQGTLYGRNTIGGVISIATKRPSDTLEASAVVEAGNFDYRRIGASVSGPIVPGAVSGKIAASHKSRSGYEHNELLNRDVNDDQAWSVRGQLLFDIGEDTSLLLTADHNEADNEPLVFETLVYNDAALAPILLGAYGLNRNADPFDRTVQADTVTTETLDASGVAATFKTKVGAFNVTNVASYRRHEYYSRTDTDRSALRMAYDGDPERVWRWSEELRIDTSTGPIDWLAGLYYFRQNSRNQSYIEIGADLADLFGDASLTGTLAGSNGELDTTSTAVFASATWAVTDRLDLTAGGRYTRDEKKIHYTQDDPLAILGGDADIRASDEWSEFTPNANIRFKFSPDVMAYATASKGFKSGGFNDALGDANGIAFGPESLWNYEAGVKASLFDRRAVLNAAVFYMKWDDIQISQDNPVTAIYDPIILNGGAAHTQGVEFELTARPTSRLDIGANLSVQEARYDEGALPDGAPLRNIPYAPNYTGMVSADYRVPLAGVGELSFYGEYEARGRSYLTANNDPDGRVSPYGLVNLRISLESEDGRWRLALWGKNLTDEVYKQRLFDLANQDLVGQKFIILGAPKTYGLELKVSY
ncbi:MAG: TonB-dependent receptor [Phenylobacterium sp.]|uniref:TonB-dependent receptor n=1 Tax=Phenylobacterium sp. TaxID=1871053 RepID=UPI00391D4BF2